MPKDYLRKFDEELLGAIARGWCSKENELKEMDSDLAFAIAKEVQPLLKAAKQEAVETAYKSAFYQCEDGTRLVNPAREAYERGKQEGREEAVAYIRAHAERTDFTDKTIYSIDGFQLEAAKEQKV